MTEEKATESSEEAEPVGVTPPDERLDEQEDESFPASDPHADWAGPGGG
jgi:hypothetical protein